MAILQARHAHSNRFCRLLVPVLFVYITLDLYQYKHSCTLVLAVKSKNELSTKHATTARNTWSKDEEFMAKQKTRTIIICKVAWQQTWIQFATSQAVSQPAIKQHACKQPPPACAKQVRCVLHCLKLLQQHT